MKLSVVCRKGIVLMSLCFCIYTHVYAEISDEMLNKLKSEPEISVAVKPHEGVPTLFLNGKPQNFMLYCTTGAGVRQFRHIAPFGKAGVHFYEIPMDFSEIFQEDGKADFTNIERWLGNLMMEDPDAYVVLRVFIQAPGWWYSRNSSEYAITAIKPSTNPSGVVGVSAASDKWQELTNKNLATYVKYLETSPYGKRILGYHVAWGHYGEWHYPGFTELPDVGPTMIVKYREWMHKHFPERKDWENLQVPGKDERCISQNDSIFRNPAIPAERDVIEYYRLQHDLVSDVLLKACHTVKENSNRKKLVGVFYGYYLYMGHEPNIQAEAGHLGMEKVLNSPDVDFMAGPYSYLHEARKVGGDGTLRGLLESIKLHGKLFLTEADEPTYLGCSQGVNVYERGTQTVAGSISAMLRNFSNVLISGTDLWWFDIGPKDDQGGIAGGWWHTPPLMRAIKQMKSIAADSINVNRTSNAQVAVVCNPDTYYYIVCSIAGKDNLMQPLLNLTVRALYHSGTSFDMLMVSDLDRIAPKKYKMFIILDTFYMTEKQRNLINEKVKHGGRTVLWVYAPGYISDNKLSAEAVSKLVEMKVSVSIEKSIPNISVSNYDDAVTKNLLQRDSSNNVIGSFGYGLSKAVAPTFCVTDDSATTLGNIGSTNKTGLAVKRFSDWTSIYTFAPPVSPDLLRAIFRSAGVHIYSDAGDVLYANTSYVAITGETGGMRTINLPYPSTVTDMLSGKVISKRDTSFTFEFMAKTVRLFKYTPAK